MPSARDLALVFLRGFAIVTATALNVSLIADRRFGAAFVCGGLLSWIWWGNAQTAQSRHVAARIWYALGASVGTVTGITCAFWRVSTLRPVRHGVSARAGR